MTRRKPAVRLTRRHVIQTFVAGIGSRLLPASTLRAWADLPWGEETTAVLLGRETAPLHLRDERRYEAAARQIAPALVFDARSDRLWTSWAELSGQREVLRIQSFLLAENTWGPVLDATAPESAENAYESDLALVNGRLIATWSQVARRSWSIAVVVVDPAGGHVSPVRLVAGSGEDEFHAHPAIAAGGDRALIVWQVRRQERGTYAILGRFVGVDGRPVGDPFEVSETPDADCCHPAIAAAPDGQTFAIAFDRQDAPGTQNIHLVVVDSRTGQRRAGWPVSHHPASDVAPALAFSPDGAWLFVAWHTNRRGEDDWDIPRWYRLAALRTRDQTWHAPPDQPEPGTCSGQGTIQGCELVRLAVSPRGVVCVLGRASHNFYVQYYSNEGRSPLYRLPEDGWGGRGRLLRGVFDQAGALWVTRRDLRQNVLHRVDGFDSLSGPPGLEPYCENDSGRPRRLSRRTAGCVWPEADGPVAGLGLYFGDLHGHSWQSDGMGDPEEAYLRARDVFRDDFHALTDHDHFIQKRLTDAQWEEQKAIAEHYHAPGRFVTLFGQEWTTPRIGQPHGWGHFNVYSAEPAIPLLDHTDPRYRDLSDLYAAVRRYQAVAIPHHIGWTGVRWEALDPELTPVVEICSVHGAYEYEGNEPIRHRGGLRGCFFCDGIRRALRLGVVGGSDQHGLLWQHGVCWKRDAYRAGLTGVWAPELSRAALLEALRARRTFATTGVKLRLVFAVHDMLMGGTTTVTQAPRIAVDVAVPPTEGRLAWLQIVRDGHTIHHYGGEGQRSRYVVPDDECPAGRLSAYWLRVRLSSGDMAWSSPVWVACT